MRPVFKVLIKTVISILILFYLIVKLNFEAITTKIGEIKPGYIILAFGLEFVSLFIMTFKWKIFVQTFSRNNNKQLLSIYWASEFVSLFSFGSLSSEIYKMLSFKKKGKALHASIMDKAYAFIWYLILILAYGLAYLIFGKTSYIFLIVSFIFYFVLVIIFINLRKKLNGIKITSKRLMYLINNLTYNKVKDKKLLYHSIISLLFVINFTLMYSLILKSTGVTFKLGLIVMIPLLIILLTLPISIQGLGVRDYFLSKYATLYYFSLESTLIASMIIFLSGVLYRLTGIFSFLTHRDSE